MRLIHAVRELAARPGRGSRPSRSTPTRTAGDVRPRGRPGLRPRPGRGPRPYLDWPARARARRGRGGRGLGRLGLRRRARRVRRALRAARDHVHRPRRRGDAPARRQDHRQAARRGGRRPGRAVERRRRRRRSTTRGAGGRRDRLSADAQGDRRRRRPRHPRGRAPTSELAAAFERARAEALAAFGNATVFLERRVTGARHVEVQIIADGHGAAWALGVRDCTVQRRHQKVLEESRLAGALAGAGRRAPGGRRAARAAAGYQNAGTVEFLYDPGDAALRVHGGQRPAAGGAPGDRGDHRARPGQAPAPRRAGGRLEGEPPPAARPRHRGPPQRRGSGARLRPAPGPHRAAAPAHRARASASTPASRGRRHPARVRLDDRQDHRLGPRPRRGAGPAAPRARRDAR